MNKFSNVICNLIKLLPVDRTNHVVLRHTHIVEFRLMKVDTGYWVVLNADGSRSQYHYLSTNL